MRALIALLLLAPLAACSEDTPPPVATPAIATPTASVAPSAAAPAALPRAVTCPDGTPTTVDFDYGGDRSFTHLLTVWTKELGRPVVDRAKRQIWFVRDDGTAHTRLAWTRVRRPVAGREWFVDGLEQCRDHARWRSVTAPAAPVTLEIGHCWVEPVVVEGRTWEVGREDQFGWGGSMPKLLDTWSPKTRAATTRGKVTIAGDVAIYRDRNGPRLTLVPKGDPWALERFGCA